MKLRNKLFSKWVDKPQERFFALVSLVLLAVGTIALAALSLSKVIDMSTVTENVLKSIVFLSLGGMCMSGLAVHSIHFATELRVEAFCRDVKTMFTRAYTWCVITVLGLVAIYLLVETGTLDVLQVRTVGRVAAIAASGLFVLGFIQNRMHKVTYTYRSTGKRFLALSSVGIAFVAVGVYLILHLTE